MSMESVCETKAAKAQVSDNFTGSARMLGAFGARRSLRGRTVLGGQRKSVDEKCATSMRCETAFRASTTSPEARAPCAGNKSMRRSARGADERISRVASSRRINPGPAASIEDGRDHRGMRAANDPAAHTRPKAVPTGLATTGGERGTNHATPSSKHHNRIDAWRSRGEVDGDLQRQQRHWAGEAGDRRGPAEQHIVRAQRAPTQIAHMK